MTPGFKVINSELTLKSISEQHSETIPGPSINNIGFLWASHISNFGAQQGEQSPHLNINCTRGLFSKKRLAATGG